MNCGELKKLFTKCLNQDKKLYYNGKYGISKEILAANNLQNLQEMHNRHVCNSKDVILLKKYCDYTHEKMIK
jgi:hypothetical protein